ncbi:MAG TPA: hypothetical protein VE569_14065 [Acidimicrobiia bacterium]|nr:hypothetical protein [Acidimicrobiia bacterium]
MTVAALLYEPAHSLEHAAYAPREMVPGHVNVDGTGVAWWPDRKQKPIRYVTASPPWSDPNLPHLAWRLEGVTVLAAVRSATPGMSYGPDSVAPFIGGHLAGVHNGWIGGFKGGVGRQLTNLLTDERFGRLGAITDSLVLFSLVAQAVEEQPDVSLSEAIVTTIETVSKTVTAAGKQATLNLVIAVSDRIVAVRTSVDFEANSLYVRESEEGVWLASEPLDEAEGWRTIPKVSLAELTTTGFSVRDLDHPGAPT